MNIIAAFKDKLEFKNYQDFGKRIGVSGDWLNDQTKKTDLKTIDAPNYLKLCEYLGISLDFLIKNFEISMEEFNKNEIFFISKDCKDIGVLIEELKYLSKQDDITIDGLLLNAEAKQICYDALDVVKILTKQRL